MKYSEAILHSVSNAVLAVADRPVAVGVDGQGGSGKSTFAGELAGILPITSRIVQGDDFYSDIPAGEKALLGPGEGYEGFFDWRRLNSEVLASIRDRASVLHYQQYDWDSEALGEWFELSMPEVVIVEGIYTLRPELRDAFDVTVFIQASAETRVKRQTSRAENSRFWIEQWMAAEEFYVANKGPWEWVDFVVDGE